MKIGFFGTPLLALLLAGCATITKGTDQTVTIDTPGYAGSMCELSSEGIGTVTLETPGIKSLPKSRHDIAVTCTNGCYVGRGVISSNMENMTAGNIVLGGVVGLGVDAMSGAMNKYTTATQITMQPGPDCQSQ